LKDRYVVATFGIWLGKTVRPGKSKFFQDFVEQFLACESLVVFSASKIALSVNIFTKISDWLRIGVARPPVILVETRFKVMVGESPSVRQNLRTSDNPSSG
jgi:hypothetical protein